MDNISYFIEACKLGAYKKKEWVFSVFTTVNLPTEKTKDHYKGKLYQRDGHPVYYLQDFIPTADPKQVVTITLNDNPINYFNGENIILVDEEIEITKSDYPALLTDKEKTTPGIFFMNMYTIYYAIQDRYPYQTGPSIDFKRIVKDLFEQAHDDVLPDEREPDKIYTSDIKKLMRAVSALAGFIPINSPSATQYTMTAAPGIAQKRKELLEKYKDQLDDPTIIVKIERELIEMDKAYIAQDPYAGFYNDVKKQIENGRKKMYAMQGLQARMDPTKPDELIDTALTEQTDISKLPAVIDGIRHGSHSRGKMTALGGEMTKFIFRIYSAASIMMEDCGTKNGIKRVIPAWTKDRYIGAYIQNGKEPLLLTEENIKDYYGKEVLMRSPAFCQAQQEGRGYCMKCMNEYLRNYKNSLASLGATVTSDMNGRFMKNMHSNVISTAPLIWENALS